MRALSLAGLLLFGSVAAPLAFAADPSFRLPHLEARGLARAAAEKLATRKVLRPQTHTTDFQGDSLGCITLTTREMRRFRYRGHAFFCEDGATGEILGALLNRSGVVRCYISGDYTGDGCYAFTIC